MWAGSWWGIMSVVTSHPHCTFDISSARNPKVLILCMKMILKNAECAQIKGKKANLKWGEQLIVKIIVLVVYSWSQLITATNIWRWCASVWKTFGDIIWNLIIQQNYIKMSDQLDISERRCSCAPCQRKWCHLTLMFICGRISLVQPYGFLLSPSSHLIHASLLWVGTEWGSEVMRR